MTLEICCPTIESVLAAYRAGADRVELCSVLSGGGVTPSAGMMLYALDLRRRARAEGRRFDVNVLVRAREGDFVYTPAEVSTMILDIKYAKSIGVDGVVIGALTPEGDIDKVAMTLLLGAAHGMSVTFHRAFDCCSNPEEMLETIIALGCDRLLTSGQADAAVEGIPLIKRLVEEADGRMSIMAGAGVDPENAPMIIKETKITEIHASAKGDEAIMTKIKKTISE